MSIDSVKFRGRHNSIRAIIYIATGAISLILVPILWTLAAKRGSTPVWMGVVGIIAAVVSLVGTVGCLRASRERDVYVAQPVAGLAVNGIAFVVYLIIYTIGAV